MREHKFYLLIFLLFNFSADGVFGCDLLFYGANEIANGVTYKAAVHFGGCKEVSAGTIDLQISLKSDGQDLLSSSVSSLVGQWNNFDLAVPDDACTVGKELTIEISVADEVPLTQSVKCSDSGNVLLVQMNKPLYKPGDAVKAQIFCVVREDTGSCDSVPIEVYITNPQGTMMNVQNYIFGSGDDEKMVVEYSYKVATKPLLGEYCLIIQPQSAQVSLKTVTKCFDIEEYVLPTFEGKVIFDQGAFVTSAPTSITGKVEATYTYGQPVLTAHYELKCWVGDDSGGEDVYTSTISESDSKSFTIDYKNLNEVIDGYKNKHYALPTSLMCQLDAKESNADNLPVQTSQASISVKEYKLSVDCCDSFSCPDVVRPGPHHICLKVTNADGSNVGEPLDDGLSLKVTFKQCQRDDQVFELDSSTVLIGDRIDFDFTALEKSDAKNQYGSMCYSSIYSLEAAVYEKSSQDAKSLVYTPTLSGFNSEIESYLSLDVCNSEAVFQVNSSACLRVNLVQKSGNADVTSVIVMVKSRGIVRNVFTETVSAFPHEFDITIQDDMAPNFVVFVSAMGSAADSSQKEALPASVTIPVQQSPALLPNQVSLQPGAPLENKEFYPPGHTVSMQVTTSAADSVVALIGIDKQMIAAAGKANIIQVDDVVEALASSGGSDDDGDIMPFFWFCMPSRSSDAQSTIKDAGFVYAVSGNYQVPGSAFEYYGFRLRSGLKRANGGGVPVEFRRVVPFSLSSSSLTAVKPLPVPFHVPSKPKVRKSFREVTLFQVMASGSDSNSFQVDIPLGDALTTHVVHASAISPTVGFGTVFEPQELLVFKEVSVNLQTPYAMKRFESFNATITACNYKSVDLMVQLTVLIKGASQDKPAEFEKLLDDCTDEISSLDSQECKVIQCPFKALKMGNPRMGLELKAKVSEDEEYAVYDQLVKKIKVKPEGCPVERSLTTVELNAGESHVFYLNVSADDAVANSGIAHVSLYSSLSAPALQNPEKLVKKPTGCGEQTMIYLAPLIYLKMILTASGMSLSVEKDATLTEFMESGYDRELTYRHPDGSYSAFGPGSDGKTIGSTWLTAFVAKTFAEALNGNYIYIDSQNVLLPAYKFMLTDAVIDKEGKVVENGEVYHSEMQGGSSGKDTMSAYHLLSLSQMPSDMFANQLESGERSQFEKLLTAVKDTIDERAEDETANNYLLCLGGNAVYDALLTKNEDPANDVLLNKVRAKVAASVSSNCGRVYWSNKEESTSDTNCDCAPEEQSFMDHYTAEKTSIKVEITGYCLAFLSKMKNSQDVLVRQQAMSWLGCQQSDLGGYSTTQNTVTGFYGLAMNAEATEATNLQITVEDSLGNSTGSFSMEDSLEVFRYEYTDVPDSFDETELTDDSSSITVTVSAAAGGQGKIYASGILYYNTQKCTSAGKDPQLTIEASVKNVQENSMQLQMAMRYSGDDAGQLGMGFFTAEAMSGFAYSAESVAQLEAMDQVQRAEINPDTNNLDIYTVNVEDITLTVELNRVEAIAGQQGATVEGGSYYQPMIQSSVLYKSEALENGDIFNVCAEMCVTNSAVSGRVTLPAQIGLALMLAVLACFVRYQTM